MIEHFLNNGDFEETIKEIAEKLSSKTIEKFLEEVFRCTEQVSTMLHNRREAITFEKMKVAVQQMLRKNFNVSYLKQIKTVFPEAYRLVFKLP